MTREIRRSEIYFVDLSGARGHEINSKRRPAVVITINDINKKPLTVVVVPGTTTAPKHEKFLNVVRIEPTEYNGLRFPTYFQCHQLRAIGHERFDELPLGTLSGSDLAKLERAIRLTLGLQDQPGQLASKL